MVCVSALQSLLPQQAFQDECPLRVGPFAGTDDVRAICGVASRWKARCTLIRDIGASSAIGGTPAHKAADNEGMAHSESARYWAQLGTYHSSQDAWDAWKELKSHHRSLLKRARPAVTTPALSSAAGDTFRLRVGPFRNESAVNNLCSRLGAAGISCVTVNDH